LSFIIIIIITVASTLSGHAPHTYRTTPCCLDTTGGGLRSFGVVVFVYRLYTVILIA